MILLRAFATLPAACLVLSHKPLQARADMTQSSELEASKPGGKVKPKKLKQNAWPAMWRVQDDDTTIYLLGTVHVLHPQTQWFSGEVKEKFDESDTLVLELIQPPEADMAAKIQKLALATDGKELSTHMTAKEKAVYITAMESDGLRWQGFEITKPWMPAIALSISPIIRTAYSVEAGVEETLSAAAAKEKKPVLGLETADEQLGYFDSMSMDQQVAFLNATVEEVPKVNDEFLKLIDAWSRGKTDILAEQMNDYLMKMPEIAKALLSDRNTRWAQWIKVRLESTPGTGFFAVGAGHLADKDSVQNVLAAEGIKAKRISTR